MAAKACGCEIFPPAVIRKCSRHRITRSLRSYSLPTATLSISVKPRAAHRRFNLFRAPLLGGSPTLLAKDVDGGPIFSPDGKRVVYSRYNDPELNKWRLLQSDADG